MSIADLFFEEETWSRQIWNCKKVKHLHNIMAVKQIHLELEEAKLQTILMELDVLNRVASEYVIQFFGAFFVLILKYIFAWDIWTVAL